MTPVDKETLDFYELVERALEGLPPELAQLLENVAIVVDEWPDYSTPLVADDPEDTLYGLYEGVPLTERGWGYSGVLPDKITIFRGPLERAHRDPRDLATAVRDTVHHEVAHHLGISDGRLRELRQRRERDRV